MKSASKQESNPLRETGSEIAVTVPRSVVDRYDLDNRVSASFIPILGSVDSTGTSTIEFRIDLRGTATDPANVRALGGSSRGRHVSLRWPLPLAESVGLDESASDESETLVRFTDRSADAPGFRLRFDPACRLCNPAPKEAKPYSAESGDLNPARRRLHSLWSNSGNGSVHAYTLELPTHYACVYDLEKGQEVGFRLGNRSASTGLDLIIDFNPRENDSGTSTAMGSIRKLQSRQIGTDRKFEQFSLYVPMALVDALGLAHSELELTPYASQVSLSKVPNQRTIREEP